MGINSGGNTTGESAETWQGEGKQFGLFACPLVVWHI